MRAFVCTYVHTNIYTYVHTYIVFQYCQNIANFYNKSRGIDNFFLFQNPELSSTSLMSLQSYWSSFSLTRTFSLEIWCILTLLIRRACNLFSKKTKSSWLFHRMDGFITITDTVVKFIVNTGTGKNYKKKTKRTKSDLW